MKSLWMKVSAVFLACLVLLTHQTPIRATQPGGQDALGQLTVSYYEIFKAGSNEKKSAITAGDSSKIKLYFKDTSKLDQTQSPSDIDVSMAADSDFKGGSVTIEKVEKESDGTTYVATFDKVSFDGKGNKLSVAIRYKKDRAYSAIAFPILEAAIKGEGPSKPEGSGEIMKPDLLITRKPLDKPIGPDQEFVVEFVIKNRGFQSAGRPVLKITPPDSMRLVDDVDMYELSSIGAGDAVTVPLRFKSNDKISSSNQGITLELRYGYFLPEGGLTYDKAVETVNVVGNGAAGSAALAKPNVIISTFSYGDQSIDAGKRFKLSVTFKNTSANRAIDNIVMTVGTGNAFTIDGSTNTYYYKALGANGSLSQEIPLQALPTAETGSQSLDLHFEYEYVDNGNRTSGQSSVKVSIPVVQPDRFEIAQPRVPETANVGEEVFLQLSYVNKGKAPVSNVAAKIEGNVDSFAKTQNLGNFEPGKSGDIGFSVVPKEPGEVEFKLIVEYENANGDVTKREFPVKMNVQEMTMPDGPGAGDPGFPDIPEEPQGFNWLPIVLGLLVLAAVVVVVIRKKHKSKKKEPVWDDAWASDDDPTINQDKDNNQANQ